MSRMTDIAVAFTVVILLASYADARRRRVDCTKFVFAPVCRGIAAKRGDTHFHTSQTLENPTWRQSHGLPVFNKESNFGPTSLKGSMLLSKILMILSEIDPNKGLSARDMGFRSPNDQRPIADTNTSGALPSVGHWLED